jgi:hypothetical protein
VWAAGLRMVSLVRVRDFDVAAVARESLRALEAAT